MPRLALPAGLVLVALCAAPAPSLADFKVRSPDAEPGEKALEEVGDYGLDQHQARSGEQSHVAEFEWGVNNFWRTEFEFEVEREPGIGQPTNFTQVTSENYFQFTERGQYWLDSGWFFEYGRSMLGNTPDETTFGPMLRKEFAGTINTVNLFLEKDIGHLAAGRPVFLYAWETRFALGTPVEPGFQAYGQPGPIGHFAGLGEQDHRIGPQLFGRLYGLGPGSLTWNGGILFGLTPATPVATLRWQLEYEVHF